MILFAFLMIIVMYLMMALMLSKFDVPQKAGQHMVCDRITSTGAPTDCHWELDAP